LRGSATAPHATAALYRLLAWLSPSYPVGAFSYSHGLEQAVEAGHVTDAATALHWIGDIVALGAGRSDGVLLAAAWRAAAAGDRPELARIAEFAAAFTATSELHLETMSQGSAFLKITAETWPSPPLAWLAEDAAGAVAAPVAVGAAAAGHGIPLEAALPACMHAFAANLVSAAVRLVPLGQTDGQRIIAALEPVIARAAEAAAATPLDDIATATLMVDITSMQHETQYTRLFRS
jgi:urease accessory protein